MPHDKEHTEARYEQYKARSRPNTVHWAAELGDLRKLDEYVQAGMEHDTPESVTLQQREEVLGMMPLHIACEKGKLEIVEVRGATPSPGTAIDARYGDNAK
jgi:hypothetical protein